MLVHLDARTHCLQFKRAVDDGGVTAAAVRAGLQVCVCVCVLPCCTHHLSDNALHVSWRVSVRDAAPARALACRGVCVAAKLMLAVSCSVPSARWR